MRGLVEKPSLEEAPGNLSIIGRYVLGPGVFDHLAHGTAGAGGEVQLTDAVAATIGEDDVFACEFEGDHYDAGEPKGLLLAALHEARSDPDMRATVLDAVTELVANGAFLGPPEDWCECHRREAGHNYH